jgi:hypothetical protein
MLSAMNITITALERAFQLARSGSCASVSEIKQRLIAERYSVSGVTGKVLSKQLQALIKAGRSSHATRP